MFKLIVIVEKSKIIREGLESLLRSNNITSHVICMESFEEWIVALKGRTPDIVIVNPDLIKEDVEKTKAKCHLDKQTFFITIIYQYYSYKEINERFDDAIYITDSENIILTKFQNLFSQSTNAPENSNEQLTGREKDVLRLLLQGFSNKEVADKLSISTHTVVSHRKNIIEKTGIRSLSGLAVYAILNNIADMEDLKQ